MSVSIQRETKGSLHQSLSLQARGKSCSATRAGPAPLGVRSRTFSIANAPAGGANHASQRSIFNNGLHVASHGTAESTFTTQHGSAVAHVVDLESGPSSLKSAKSILGWDAAASLQPAGGWKRQWQSRAGDGHQHGRSRARQLPGAALLGQHRLLRAELPRRRSFPLQLHIHHRRWLHQSLEQLGSILLGTAEQCQSKQHHREHPATHRERSSLVLRRRRGLRRMFIGLGDLRSVAELQSPSRLSSQHGLQDSAWMFAENLQQSGVRAASIAVGESRLWSGLRTDEDVHHSNEFREGLGSGISPTRCDFNALLDRDPPSRTAPMARQGFDSNGQPA